ncbi:MAG: hypothetical protein Q9217_000971 [Psora testacea]
MYSDGIIEFRDSQSLQLLPPDPEGQISSLSFLEIVNEAFVTQLSIASRAYTSCTEDVLSAVQLFTSQYINLQMQLQFAPSLANSSTFNRRLLSGMYRILGVGLDHAMDTQPDQSYKNTYFQRCLGVQASLGFPGDVSLRPTEGIVALVMLSLRLFSIVLSYASTRKGNEQVSEALRKPGERILVLFKFDFITDELSSILHAFEGVGISQNHIDANLVNQNIRESQSPALPLLFISTSRAMFRYNCRYIRVLAAESEKHRDSTPLSKAYRELDIILQRSPVSLQQFEKVLNQVDDSIKIAYQSSTSGEADRRNAEKDMLIRAEIPQNLIEPVKQLLYQTVVSLRCEINEAELYFMDVGGLGLTNDNTSMKRNREHPTDVIQKTPLRREAKVRRCIRCSAFMEDVLPQRNGNPILALLGRTCCCGSFWMLIESDEVAQLKV